MAIERCLLWISYLAVLCLQVRCAIHRLCVDLCTRKSASLVSGIDAWALRNELAGRTLHYPARELVCQYCFEAVTDGVHMVEPKEQRVQSAQCLRYYMGLQSGLKVCTARLATERPVQHLKQDRQIDLHYVFTYHPNQMYLLSS